MNLPKPSTRQTTSLVLVVAMLAGFVWAASRAEGYVTPEPDLHDAGIWVTRTDQRRIGRTNTEIATVDTSLTVAGTDFDVLQSGADVVVHQTAPAALVGVDPVTAVTIPGPELPADAQVEMGGAGAAVLDPSTGELHVTSADGLLGVELGTDEGGTATLGEDAVMAVGVDGTVHTVDREGVLRSWRPSGEELEPGELDVDADSRLQISAVGDEPVVLEVDTARLHTPAGPVDVTSAGSEPVLQQPGGSTVGVLVAGSDALVRVELATGTIEEVVGGGRGNPSAPAHLLGCDYVAWAGNGLVARACEGGEPQTRQYEQFATGGQLTWRINRQRILLNELITGRQLVYGEGDPVYVEEWAEALSEEVLDDEETVDDADQALEQTIDRTRNDPPVAVDDEAGTRTGRPVVVRPLRNDSDPDGDVLVITELEKVAEDAGRADLIDGGRGVLVEIAPDRTEPLRFRYTISDGNDHTASATVTVSVVPDDVNRPPVAAQGEQTTVVAGGTVLHNVLADAFDPDGDPISVLSATAENAGDVPFEASGELAYTATNAPGPDDVTYVLVDDRAAEGTGMLRVNVVPNEANEPPVARSDFATTLVGREVVLDVLDNDTDANGDELTMVRVDDYSNANVRWDPESPEIRVTADRPGTVNLVYRITDGQATDEGLVRIDVAEPTTQFPPVAVRDDVRLTPGVPSYVPVLDNDVDPDGEVLLVVGVDVPPDAPFDVAIVDRTQLRIETDRALQDAHEFDYRITDGSNEVTGRVVVAPAPVREQNQPPVVGPDEFTVRAGGIAVLPVMANDSDPDGDTITLVEPEPVDDATAARDGRLFLSDGLLRYEAPTTPKATVIQRSTIMDSASNTASGQLLIHVIEPSGEVNSPPVAPTLTGRVLAGGRVAIRVPLATMDPEGDAVQLLGVGDPPTLGAVVEVLPDELVYDADASSAGTDQFTYRVRDQFGLEAQGTVLVGVAGTSSANNDPSAGDDLVNVVPGMTVNVPVLDNDSDPDGDQISVSTEADDELRAPVGESQLVDGEVRYTAPASPPGDQTSFQYVVTDGRGGRDTGTVVVQFVDELPNRAPEPVDDHVGAQLPGAEVTTDPLQGNDLDPDGDDLEVLSISLDDEDAELLADGRVSLTMPDGPLQFTYEVTDGTEVRRAAVIVPLLENAPPVAAPDEATVDMSGEVTIDVLANDSDPEGADLVLLDVVGVRNGTTRVEGDQVVFTASRDQFVGDAGFAYRVADSTDPTTQLVSTGVVQVTIEGTLNTPPSFTSLSVEIPQGAQRTLDLGAAVQDPDSGQTHQFRDLTGGGEGLSAAIEGDDLVIDASLEATVGTVGDYELTVDDGTATTVGVVSVQVVTSDEPLVTAVPDTAETIQGQPVDIDVLGNDVNPFPETPLTILDVTSPTGAQVTTDGATVRFSPDPERRDLGELSFEYTVGDATGDVGREVTGTVRVTVIGRPEIPAAPTCIGGESEVVQIGWAAPAANGAPITAYHVRITAGGVSEVREYPGGSTVQAVEGLANGVEHTFEVAAVNEAVVGALEFGPPSPACTPDQVPDRPQPPVSTFGDGELHLSFEAPPVNGSPVSALTLTNATTGEAVKLGPTQTDYTWTGLENGTSYRFTLTATNERGDSQPSELSTGDGIPAGVPLNAVAPTTEQGDRFLTVRWTRPDENGAPIVEYRITIIRAGVEQGQVSIPDGNRFSTIVDTDNGVEYRFRLEARNKAGWSAPSPASDPAVSAGKPFKVGQVTASEGDTTSTLSFSEPDDNGAAITSYDVSVNGGGWTGLASDRIVRNLTNGTNYSFRVRAVNSEGAGPASDPSSTINPYGQPDAPVMLTPQTTSSSITFRWNAVDGDGRTVIGYRYQFNGSNWSSRITGTSVTKSGLSPDTPYPFRVEAITDGTDTARKYGRDATQNARTNRIPITISAGSSAQGMPGCSSSACRFIRLQASGLSANTTYHYRAWDNVEGVWWADGTFRTNGSGAFDGDLTTYYGFPGRQVEIQPNGVNPDIPNSSNRYTWPS